MKNKKSKIIPLSAMFAMIVLPAFADDNGMCKLITELKDVFSVLRTLAFVGAGFILMKYAWEAITTNKIGQKDMMEGIKTVGVSMIVGFVLLFSVGIVLSALLNGKIISCPEFITGQW